MSPDELRKWRRSKLTQVGLAKLAGVSLRTVKRWEAGKSGNPTGRPRADPDVRKDCRLYTRSALRRLAALAGLSQDEDKLIKPTGTPSVQLAATIAILDRGHGRPEQSIHLTGDASAQGDTANDAALLIAEIRAELARRARDVQSTAIALPAGDSADPLPLPDPAK